MAFFTGSLWAQSSALDELAKAAEKEPPAEWYDSSPEDQTEKIIATFNARYPKVKIRHIRLAGGVDIAARMVQEARAKGEGADLATLAVEQVLQLHNRGLLAMADWQSYGVPKTLAPEPFAVATTSAIYVIIYNTDQVKPVEAPKNWEDLLNPRWKGKIGAWVSAQALAQLVPAWGAEKATDYANKFAAQNPILYKSTFPLAQDVAAGEIPVAVGIYHSAQPALAKGAPIKLVLPNPTSKSTIYSVVAKSAQSPNAAKLFVAWLASPAGARAYEDATSRGNPLISESRASQMLQGLHQSEFPLQQTAEGAKWLTQFSEALKKGSQASAK